MRNQTDFGTITGFGTLIAIIGFALIGPSEQRTDNNPKNDLTGKAPYRFESTSLHRGVWCEPDFRGRIPSITSHHVAFAGVQSLALKQFHRPRAAAGIIFHIVSRPPDGR